MENSRWLYFAITITIYFNMGKDNSMKSKQKLRYLALKVDSD